MENTTKALMMAAGVLIGIIILSLTVYLVNSIQGFSSNYNSSLELQQLEQFNTNFTVFEGRNNISFHEIMTLVNLAKEFNKTNNLDKNDSQYIHVYAKYKSSSPVDLTTEDNLDQYLDGSYIMSKYPNFENTENKGGYFRYKNIYNDEKVKTQIIYYNCYKCAGYNSYKNYYINPNTGRIEYITFIFQEEYTQNIIKI